MKFGGTSLGDSDRIKDVCQIVKDNSEHEIVVVVSALGGVTDLLVKSAQKISVGQLLEEDIKDIVGELFERHRNVATEVQDKDELELAIIELEKLSKELEKVLTGILYVGEITPRSSAYVNSFGERMSAPIVSGALSSCGINSNWLTGYEAGIVTEADYDRARPIWTLTNKNVKNRLEAEILNKKIPVITGYIAGDSEGRITTLGRGGSDYTAAIIGAAIDADEVWIWTDVDGILTTDPKLVKDAKPLPIISYIEAMELAHFGAKVLHPKSIEPAMKKGVPVRVKNTFNPNHPGTLIVSEQEKAKEVVKAVSIMNDVAMLTISGVGMIGVPGVAAKIFTALAQEKVNILMISQGSSEVNISFIVEKQDLKKAVRSIKETFLNQGVVRKVDSTEDVAIIAVIGAGMKGTKGVAARVFTAIAKADVNILMIAQGSSEVNISFVVSEEDAQSAAKALHKEFITI